MIGAHEAWVRLIAPCAPVTQDTVTCTDELYSGAETVPACAQLPVTVGENDISAEHTVSVCLSPLDLW